MRQSMQIQSVILTLVVSLAAGMGVALAGGSEVAGSFSVNNDLPDGWDLSAVLVGDGETEALATNKVTSDGSTVAFSFAHVEPGSYRVRLLATKDDTVLGLSETSVLEVGSETSESPSDAWKAIGSGGAVSGEIALSGKAPEGKMILVRVSRVDIDLEGKFPDQLNAFTVEVQPDEIEAGKVTYEMSGLSHGLYAVELIAYHYESHTTKPIDAYTERLIVDLDHEEYQDIDFKVDF